MSSPRWKGSVEQISFSLEWKREAVMDGKSGDNNDELAGMKRYESEGG